MINSRQELLEVQKVYDKARLGRIWRTHRTEITKEFGVEISENDFLNFFLSKNSPLTASSLFVTKKGRVKLIRWLITIAKEEQKLFNEAMKEETSDTYEQDENNKENTDLHLMQLFKEPNLFLKVIDLLSKEEYINLHSRTWTSRYKKGELPSILKHLHTKGFLKKKPTAEMCMIIARNDFSIEISESTADKSREREFEFIPYASTLT